MADSSSTSSGIGISGLLLVAFIVMKLAGIGVVAEWSWWWVTAPIWLPLGFVLLILLPILTLLKMWGRRLDKKKQAYIRSKYPEYGKSKFQSRLDEMMEKQKQARAESKEKPTPPPAVWR